MIFLNNKMKSNQVIVLVISIIVTSFVWMSCSKDNHQGWLEKAEEAVLMGYTEISGCAGGFVFDIIPEDVSVARTLKYAHSLPEGADADLYRYYPIKVKLLYEKNQDSCAYMNEVIDVLKIEVIR